jgi:hypothetical protein
MEKYKRFKEQLPNDEAIQEFLDTITTEGWEIIYYDEKAWGGMGIMEVIVVGRKKQEVL